MLCGVVCSQDRCLAPSCSNLSNYVCTAVPGIKLVMLSLLLLASIMSAKLEDVGMAVCTVLLLGMY